MSLPSSSDSGPDATTVLVLEDDESVRLLVRRTLEDAGYAVLDAADGEAGLQLLEEHSDSVNVVVTDLVMPGFDGDVVTDVVVQHRPGIAVVQMAAGPLTGPTHGVAGEPSYPPLLQKPFTPDALLDTIRAVLQRSAVLEERAARARRAAGRLRAEANHLRAVTRDLVTAARSARARRAKDVPHTGAPKPLRCPACGSDRVIPIVYGPANPELMRAYGAGVARIGGLYQSAESPQWSCRECEARWRA